MASFFSCDATAHRRFIKSTVLAGKYGDSYKIELIPEVTNPFTLKYIERVCVCVANRNFARSMQAEIFVCGE